MEDLFTLDWWGKTSMVTHLILIMTVWFLEETRYWLCYFFLSPCHHLSHLSTPTTTIWHHTARHWGPSLSISPIGQLRHPDASRDPAPIKNNTWTALATLVCDTHRGSLKVDCCRFKWSGSEANAHKRKSCIAQEHAAPSFEALPICTSVWFLPM